MRSQSSVVALVTSSAGLELVICCPVCGKRGAVTLTNYDAPFQCPDCRQTFQLTRGCELRWTHDSQLRQPEPRRRAAALRSMPNETYWGWALLLGSAAIVFPLVGVFWWASAGGGPPSSSRAITEAARAFTEAWLAGDRQGALAWIDGPDRPLFHAWWQWSRAVLTTGAGTHFRWGNVTADLMEEHDDRAVVRVRFDAGRSEQQRSQTWKQTAAGWKLDLPRDSSPFPNGAD